MKRTLLFNVSLIFLGINLISAQPNWELLHPKPTEKTGKAIEFVSSKIGYIITSNELLETRDTGTSWHVKQEITSGNDISFYNKIGFIAGDKGYVLKSTNSGKSWNQISTGVDESFNTVNIIDNENVILSTNNSIVKSIDGGATWESLPIPGKSVNKTFFVNALTGHTACNYGMLKTVDGGETWYAAKSPKSNFFTVYFINENIGFSSRETSDIFKTIDGGETWSRASGTGQAAYNFHFLNEKIGFSTGGGGGTFKTTDGGDSWKPIRFKDRRFLNTSFYAIHFFDENIGFTTGGHGRISKTTDGGKTWTDHSLYNDFNQLQFLDKKTAYVCTKDNFYKSKDAGYTWSLIGSLDLESNASIDDFYFVNENTGYASTNYTHSAKAYKTVDGGVNWETLTNDEDITGIERISTIFFMDENTGFLSGSTNRGKIMKTTDGGATWHKVSFFLVKKFQFINDQLGFAYGGWSSYNKMYKTTDGGDTWSLNFEVDEDIRDFHFVDENNGYFVGDQKLLYKTSDGAKSWQQLNIPYDDYTLVKFYTKYVGYIADEDGKIYKTMNGGESWKHITTKYGT